MGEINQLLPKCDQVNVLLNSVGANNYSPLQPYLGQTFTADAIRELFSKYQQANHNPPKWCVMGNWNQEYYLGMDKTTYQWFEQQGLFVGANNHSPLQETSGLSSIPELSSQNNHTQQYGFYQIPGQNNTSKNYLLSDSELKLKQQTLAEPGKLTETIFSDDPFSYLALNQFLQLANQKQELHQLPTQLHRSKPFYFDAMGLKTAQSVAGGSGPYYNLYVVVENYFQHQCEQKPELEKYLELDGLTSLQIADLVRIGNFLPEQTCSYADRFYLPKDVYKLKTIHDYLNHFIDTTYSAKNTNWNDFKKIKNITEQIAAILPDEGPASLGTGRWWLEKLSEGVFLTIVFGPSVGLLMHTIQNRMNPQHNFAERLLSSGNKWLEYYLGMSEAESTQEKSATATVRKIIDDLEQSKLKSQKGAFIYSEVFPKKAVYELAQLLGIQESKIPDLILAAADIKVQNDLTQLAEKQINLNKLMDWLKTDAGSIWLKENHAKLKDTLGKRFLESGPSLAIGILTMLGAEQIADILGLDSYQHAQERFLFILASAYTGQHLTQGLTEITLNAIRKQPYVLARPQMLNGDFIYKFTSSRSWSQWLTQGSKSFFKNIPESLSNMGVGILTSLLSDQFLGRNFANTPRQRELIRLGGFFFPEVYKMAWGNRRWHIFENKYVKGLGLLTMSVTVGDMVYGWLRKDDENKVELAYEMSVKQRAYPHFANNITTQLVPNLAFAQGIDMQDAACQKIIAGDQEMAKQVQQAAQVFSMAQLIRLPFTEISTETFDKMDLAQVFNNEALYPADQRLLDYMGEHMGSPLRETDIREKLLTNFPYEKISAARMENLMTALQKNNLQNAIKSLQWINLPEAEFARNYFDASGQLKSGVEQAWIKIIMSSRGEAEGPSLRNFPMEGASLLAQHDINNIENNIVDARKLALALQMLEHPELRSHPNLVILAQHAGLMNQEHAWIENDLFKQALATYQQMHPDLARDLVAQIKIQTEDENEQKLYDIIIAQL